MRIHEMTDEECREVLTGKNVARLACALNNQPYVVPIRLDLEGQFLYGYATLGQKIEWMRQNPLVCVEVDEVTASGDWVNVIVIGHYEELPHLLEYEDSAQDGRTPLSATRHVVGASCRPPGSSRAKSACRVSHPNGPGHGAACRTADAGIGQSARPPPRRSRGLSQRLLVGSMWIRSINARIAWPIPRRGLDAEPSGSRQIPSAYFDVWGR